MPDPIIPSTIHAILLSFAPCFTLPGFENFVAVVTAWIVCPGRRTVSRMIQVHAAGSSEAKHHSAIYRFFAKGRWSTDAVSEVLFRVLLPFLPERIVVPIDDTLSRRTGPHFFGAGMHHDTARSTYRDRTGVAAGRNVSFAFGHSWVLLAVWVPMPWNSSRGLAVPILFRLYRSKKTCPESLYSKRTELAAELLRVLASWLPQGRTLIVVADREYACKTVVRRLQSEIDFVGGMPMDAALHAEPRPYRGLGRPAKKGKRLPSPLKLAKHRSSSWTKMSLAIYAKTVTMLTKTIVCLWPTVAGTRLVRVVVTRDPRGLCGDRAYFTTVTSMPVEEMLTIVARRWEIEVAIRNAKQHIGVGDPQNGWWRRKHGTRRPQKQPGPNPRGRRGEKAVLRTLPLGFITYALVIAWYLRHGDREADVRRVRERAPWYTHKREPSFMDMLTCARRECWTTRFSMDPRLRRVHRNLIEVLSDVLWAV